MLVLEGQRLYDRASKCLGRQRGEGLQDASYRVLRTPGAEHRVRMAAHAVLDIPPYRQGDSQAPWDGLERAIRIYGSFRARLSATAGVGKR